MFPKKLHTSSLLVLSLIPNLTLAFGVSFFSSGSLLLTGSTTEIMLTSDTPKLVNVKFASQNPDNTLTSIESSTLYNAAPTSPFYIVDVPIPDSLSPGINYWLLAMDAADSTHYATIGPFSVNAMFASTNPSASVTINSGTTYQTSGGAGTAIASATRTSTGPTSAPTSGSTKASSTASSSKSSPTNTNTEFNPPSIISTSTIVGIAVGGVFGLSLITLTVYCCFFKKAVEVLAPALGSVAARPNNNNNNGSSIPIMTANSVNSAPATNIPGTTLTPPAKTDSKSSNTSPTVMKSPPPTYPQSLGSPTLAFSPTIENTFNYENGNSPTTQYQHKTQAYPYPYPYNENNQNLPYPAHDSMPMPEHFTNENQPYPPVTTNQANGNYSYSFQQQQPYPPFDPNQQQQMYHQYNNYPSQTNIDMRSASFLPSTYNTAEIANNAANAADQSHTIEHNNNIMHVDTPLSQKVEYDGMVVDKEEYYHKPDSTEMQQALHQKPHDATPPAIIYKSHE